MSAFNKELNLFMQRDKARSKEAQRGKYYGARFAVLQDETDGLNECRMHERPPHSDEYEGRPLSDHIWR